MPNEDDNPIAEVKIIDDGTVLNTPVSLSDLKELTPIQEKALQMRLSLPSVSVHCDRKVYLGNYETMSVGTTVYMPVGLDKELRDAMMELQSIAISDAYKLAAVEINERYKKIVRAMGNK